LKYPTNDKQAASYFGSAIKHVHGDIMTNNDTTHQAAPPATPAERPNLDDLDLTPQGLADAPAGEADPDSLVYVGNS
jgi:hypothetical protein